MALSTKQKDLISSIDKKVKNILAKDMNEGLMETTIMIDMMDEMPKILELIKSADMEELDEYCNSRDGFCRYMEILENLATGLARGEIEVPK